MDGLQLLTEIKRRFPDLPVIMATACSDDHHRHSASELGAFEFLTKPVKFDLLEPGCGRYLVQPPDTLLMGPSPGQSALFRDYRVDGR